jgi:hypothetical protein
LIGLPQLQVILSILDVRLEETVVRAKGRRDISKMVHTKRTLFEAFV